MTGHDIFDLAILLTLCAFAIRGFINGFVVECAGIISIIAAFFCARQWQGWLAPRLDFISDPGWRSIAACAIIFIAVLIGIGILARLLKKLLAFSFAGWLDKLGGAALGLAKGVIIWTLAFIVIYKLFYDSAFIRDSRAAPWLLAFLDYIGQWLPPELVERLGV